MTYLNKPNRPSQTTAEATPPNQPQPQTSPAPSGSEVNLKTALGAQIGVTDQFSEQFSQSVLDAAAAQAAQLTGLILNYPMLVSSIANQQLSQAIEDGTLGKPATCPQFKVSSKPSEAVAKLLESGRQASLKPQSVDRLKALPSASLAG
jgi:hypothetical protein